MMDEELKKRKQSKVRKVIQALRKVRVQMKLVNLNLNQNRAKLKVSITIY